MKGAWSTAFIIAQKDLKALFKSKRRVFLLYGFPVLVFLVIILGSSASFLSENTQESVSNQNTIQLWVIDENPSAYTNELIGTWKNTSVFNITVYTGYSVSVDSLLQDQKFQVITVIPANYTTLVTQKKTARVFVYYNQDDFQASYGVDVLKEKTSSYNVLLVEREYPGINLERVTPVITPYSKNKGLPNIIATSVSILPLYLAFVLVSPSLSIIILSIITEREQKTLEALLLQPVSRFGIFLGKLLYGVGIIILNILGYVVMGVFILGFYLSKKGGLGALSTLSRGEEFSFNVGDEFLLYVVVGVIGFLLIAFLLLSIAIFISFVSKDEREANLSFGMILTIPLFIIPIFVSVASSDAPLILEVLLSFTPIVGFFMGFFTMLTTAKLTVTTIVSLIAQLYYTLVFLRASTVLSESDSLLEITWSKAGNYLLKSMLLL